MKGSFANQQVLHTIVLEYIIVRVYGLLILDFLYRCLRPLGNLAGDTSNEHTGRNKKLGQKHACSKLKCCIPFWQAQ